MIGGVSQQDASVRQPSQLEEALNCNFSPSRGAGPRAPARFVQVLGSDIPDTAFFHSIMRDSKERYIVCIYPGRVRVFNHETGREYQVNVDQGSMGYLNTLAETWKSLRAVTVDDYTFIANRDVVVRLSGQVTPGIVSGSAQTFQDLPKTAMVGTPIYEIRGDNTNAFDNYFVQYESMKVWREVAKPGLRGFLDAATMPHGLKRIPDSINPDGFYFSYGPLPWEGMFAGDTDSSPPPSFVDHRIGDLFFHKDRLGIVGSNGNVVMSEVGQYYNFWRTSVTSLLDSDVIDVNAPTSGVAEMLHAVPYQKALMVFATGSHSLFQLTGAPTLTPKTVQIDPVTTYQVHPVIKPVLAGSSLFFADDSSAKMFTTVREYFVSDEQVTPTAADVTAHVPAYVPGSTRCMTAAVDADLVLLAHDTPSGSQLYVHQFRWVGDEKQQSAWSPWAITTLGKVVHMNAIGTDLYIVAKAPAGGVEMVVMDLSTSPVFPLVSSKFDICLDRREVVMPTYFAFGNYTDLTVPFTLPTMDGLVVLKTTDFPSPGAHLELTGATLVNGGQTLRLPGNKAQGRYVIGYRYKRRLTLSQQYVRDQNNTAKLVGRLQLRRMTVRFTDAAYFRCLVYPKGRDQSIDTLVPQLTNTFTSRTAGDAAFVLDTPNIVSGSHTFLVASKADQVNVAFDSDSPYPAWFQSVQWEANYTTKVRQ
jgi:hypothetical protein